MKFEAKDKKVIDVLFSNYRFRVPRYQRPYAWDIDQITEFWTDLTTYDEPYFLGSIILNYEPWDSEGVVDIIDGQQRLLTITLFTAVLRNIVQHLSLETSARIHRQDIMFEDREGEQSPRIIPGESTKPFYEEWIQNPYKDLSISRPATPEEKRIKSNYLYLHERIINDVNRFQEKEKQIERINALRKKIGNLIVIHVHIENEEEAYEIFETTNARGVDLSVADLLKNIIFKKIPQKGDRDIAKEIWQEITNNVESTSTEMKRFLRYFWISRDSFVQEKKLFREIKKQITDWEEVLDSLWNDSETWNLLLEGNENDFIKYKDGHKLYESVFALRVMGVTQCYVFLLSILRNMKKIKTNPLGIFQLIEKFTFQYSTICKRPANVVEKIYSRYAIQIQRAVMEEPEKRLVGKIQSIFSEFENELLKHKPSKESFIDQFDAIYYRNSANSRLLIKYILNKYNIFLESTGEYKIDFYNVNIEHILPQSPHKKWGLKRAEIKPYVNMLGNLILLSKRINSKVQNNIIEDKISFYENSELAITKHFVQRLKNNELRWDETEIHERQRMIAEVGWEHLWKL